MGVSALSNELKTPDVTYILYSEREKIKIFQEYIIRQQQAPLTENRIHKLIYTVTGNLEIADLAKAKFILEDSKKDRK